MNMYNYVLLTMNIDFNKKERRRNFYFLKRYEYLYCYLSRSSSFIDTEYFFLLLND